MRRLLTTCLTLLFLTSCKPAIDALLEEEKAGAESSTTLAQLVSIQGEYSKCGTSLVYSGYHARSDVLISGNNITLKNSTHGSSNCTDPYGHARESYEIIAATVNESDSTLLDITMKVVKHELYPTHGYYSSQNYCGIAGMPLNQYTDLTGLSCPTYLSSDAHHSSIHAAGTLVYSTIKIVDSDTIQIIQGFTDSGDSEAERMETDLFEVDKI